MFYVFIFPTLQTYVTRWIRVGEWYLIAGHGVSYMSPIIHLRFHFYEIFRRAPVWSLGATIFKIIKKWRQPRVYLHEIKFSSNFAPVPAHTCKWKLMMLSHVGIWIKGSNSNHNDGEESFPVSGWKDTSVNIINSLIVGYSPWDYQFSVSSLDVHGYFTKPVSYRVEHEETLWACGWSWDTS